MICFYALSELEAKTAAPFILSPFISASIFQKKSFPRKVIRKREGSSLTVRFSLEKENPFVGKDRIVIINSKSSRGCEIVEKLVFSSESGMKKEMRPVEWM